MDESKEQSQQPTPMQDFIFVRELSEVYLLLDHVSGRWDKSLNRVQNELPRRRNVDWVREVCDIGWPVEGNGKERAEQAATLLNAKDHFNAAAKPATGLTVAFTLMVVAEGRSPRPFWQRLFRRPFTSFTRFRDPVQLPGMGFREPPTRLFLARTAFPGLITTARRFQWRIKIIVWMLALWMLFTCVLSWNVGAGNLILSQLDRVRAERVAIGRDIISAESSAASTGVLKQAAVGLTEPLLVRFCERPQLLAPVRSAPGKSITLFNSADEIHLCDALSQNDRDRAVVAESVDDLLDHWSGVRWVSWTRPQPGPFARSAAHIEHERGVDEALLRMLTQLLGNSVLPLCYGILGAGAAVVRDLWGKMRESTLSPRDYPLALGQLALGAVIGACIGLFIAPTGAGQPGALVAGTALTGSALSFIAGFGVEGVFVALESLMRRIFNLPGAADKK